MTRCNTEVLPHSNLSAEIPPAQRITKRIRLCPWAGFHTTTRVTSSNAIVNSVTMQVAITGFNTNPLLSRLGKAHSFFGSLVPSWLLIQNTVIYQFTSWRSYPQGQEHFLSKRNAGLENLCKCTQKSLGSIRMSGSPTPTNLTHTLNTGCINVLFQVSSKLWNDPSSCPHFVTTRPCGDLWAHKLGPVLVKLNWKMHYSNSRAFSLPDWDCSKAKPPKFIEQLFGFTDLFLPVPSTMLM